MDGKLIPAASGSGSLPIGDFTEEEAAADALQKKVAVVAKRIVACQCITDVHVICVQRKRFFVQEDDLEAPNTDDIHPRALRSSLNREMALNAALSKKPNVGCS
jgi:hypothetical protein